MARALFREVVQDQYGNKQAGVVVHVYESGTTTPIAAAMHTLPVGGSLVANPLTTDGNGVVTAWLDAAQAGDLLVVQGAVSITVPFIAEDGGSGIKSTTVTLSAAQILALDTTPVQFTPAPGANKLIVPINGTWVYHFGTIPYRCDPATTAPDERLRLGATPLSGFWQSSGILRSQATDRIGFDPGGQNFANIHTTFANQPLSVMSNNAFTWGAILTSSRGAGGAGYAPGDTGTVDGAGSADATYVVDTVATGAVATYHLSGVGTAYAPANGVTTTKGGAQPGVGAGFTVNVLTVQHGDGTLSVTVDYTVRDVS